MREICASSTTSSPELVARLNVGDSRTELVDEFARREAIESVHLGDGGAGATLLLGRFEVGDSEGRHKIMETIAERTHEICRRSVDCKFEMLEIRLTIISDENMNVDFYLPRRLLLDAIEYDLDILIAAL